MRGADAGAQCVAGVCTKLREACMHADNLQSADDKQDLRVGFNFKLHIIIVQLRRSIDGISEQEI